MCQRQPEEAVKGVIVMTEIPEDGFNINRYVVLLSCGENFLKDGGH
jgi:hypothetical protein